MLKRKELILCQLLCQSKTFVIQVKSQIWLIKPIFITKNGYSDLVVMSSELYDKFAKINRIDQAIFESEKEMEEGGSSIDLDEAFEKLNRKYYG